MVANTQIHSIVIIQKVFHNPHKGPMPRIPVYSISHPALTFRLPGVFKDFATKCTIDQGIETGSEQCSLSGDKMMNPKRHQIKFHFWVLQKAMPTLNPLDVAHCWGTSYVGFIYLGYGYKLYA